MKIHEANIDDCDLLAPFARRTFLAAYGGDNPPERVLQHVRESLTDDQLQSELRDANFSFLLATEPDGRDDRIVGYVKLRWQQPIKELDDPAAAQLERIYVDQETHSRGVGSALLSAAAERASRQAAQWLWLGVWQENERAQRFYEKNGFARVGETYFMMGDVREDDYLYARSLNAKS